MIGFYYGSGKPGIDYPNSRFWPGDFVPVAIHTMEGINDHVNFYLICLKQLK